METTYNEYKALMKKMISHNASPYIAGSIAEFEAIVEEIEAVEEAHPEYEGMIAENK